MFFEKRQLFKNFIALGILLAWPLATTGFVDKKEGISLRALAPDSMIAVNQAIEAKLRADLPAYARALVVLTNNRLLLSPSLVPSDEVIASHIYMVNAYFSSYEIQSQLFIEAFEKTKPSALATIAKEAADAEATFAGLTNGLEQYGNGQTKKELKPAGALWQTARPLKDGGIVASVEGVRKLKNASQAISSLVDKVAVPDRIFRNILVSRFIWSSLALTWFFVPDVKDETLVTLMQTLQTLTKTLSPVERTLLDSLLEERLAAQLETFVAKDAIANRIQVVSALQKSNDILCQPGESSIVADYMLQIYRLAKFSKTSLPEFPPVFEKCAVGTKILFPLERGDRRGDTNALTAYLPRYSPSAVSLRASEPAFKVAGSTAKVSVKNEVQWNAWFALAGLSQQASVDVLMKQNCSATQLKAAVGLCLQLAWLRGGRSLDRNFEQIVKRFPRDKLDLVFSSSAQRALQTKMEGEEFLQKAGLPESYPEYPTLEWLVRNKGFFTR